MKKLLLLILPVAATITVTTRSFGQGHLIYQTVGGATPILLYNYLTETSTSMYGSAGTYDFGLYMGPAGSTSLSQMQLVDFALNPNAPDPATFPAGQFVGGIVTSPGNVANTLNFQADTQYAFLIAGWSAVAGSTYEQAYASDGPGVYLGISDLGFVTPVESPNVIPNVFGTGPGQILGFTLYGTPEPAAVALGSLGAAVLLLFRRRKPLKNFV